VHDDRSAHGAHDADGAHGGSGGHLHDAPPAMALVLIVLAIGSVAAGYVGLPRALGGSNRIESFLEESFTAARPEHGSPASIAAAAAAAAPGLPAGSREAENLGAAQADHGEAAAGKAAEGLERGLMGVSTLIAFAGIGLAAFFFLKNRPAADAVAARFSGLHRLLSHKYYVDEIYDATIVQPIRMMSEHGLWKGLDVQVIDGAVNGAGQAVNGWAALLRRFQSGSVRAYAASLMLGVVLILGYYLWR
jgi:NADH-quinone oxidoreductase subunit L